jgi:hypothetical protein
MIITGRLGHKRPHVSKRGRFFFAVYDGERRTRCVIERAEPELVAKLSGRGVPVEITGMLVTTPNGPEFRVRSVQVLGGAP